jgi:hypothetical protein
MTQKALTDAVSKIVHELTDFSSEDRHRIVAASMTLLGEVPTKLASEGAGGEEASRDQRAQFPAKARNWIQQHGLTTEQIEQVFHFDDSGAQIIAHVPGATKKEQVRNAYVLCGIARLLVSGESRFEDQAARVVCESGGFFDASNHMKAMKCSEFTGSRERGWVLTAPGMNLGASLIVQLGNV